MFSKGMNKHLLKKIQNNENTMIFILERANWMDVRRYIYWLWKFP